MLSNLRSDYALHREVLQSLTDHNKQQSIDRSGGKYGNKGTECALAALKMMSVK